MLETQRRGEKKQRTYLSLPKNGSSSPLEFVTQNHGHPNAPRSRASFVLSFSSCLYSALFAPSRIDLTSDGEKRFERTVARRSGLLTSTPCSHISMNRSRNVGMRSAGCWALMKPKALCGSSERMGKNDGVLTFGVPKYFFALALSNVLYFACRFQ